MKTILSILLFLVSSVTNAQRVVSAEATPWVGGVCCVHGTRYEVQLDCDLSFSSLSVDKVWLKNQPDPVSGQLRILNDTVVVVYFNVSIDEGRDYGGFEVRQFEVNEAIEKPTFEGEALIILANEIKDFNIIVDSFKMMPIIAYP